MKNIHNKYIQVVILCLVISLSFPSYAWKPYTHVYLAEQAINDALEDGYIEIFDAKTKQFIGRYQVDNSVVDAIKQYKSQYRAGVLGPDAYPDLITGQQIIHSNNKSVNGTVSNDWLEYIWGQSKKNESKAVIAFTMGYLTHAAGDMFGHNFVNKFTGGEFEFGENAIKHVLLEEYIKKRTPAVESYEISINGVSKFIENSLVKAYKGGELEAKLLLRSEKGKFSIPKIYSDIRNRLQREIDKYENIEKNYNKKIDKIKKEIESKENEIENCPLCIKNARLFIEIGGLEIKIKSLEAEKTSRLGTERFKRLYNSNWRDDIDKGLAEFPHFSHKVAKAIIFGPKVDYSKAKELAKEYADNHLLSMRGKPDAINLDAPKQIKEILNALNIPDPFAVLDKMRDDLIKYTIEKATGISIERFIEISLSPESHFDDVMTKGKGTQVSLDEFNKKYLGIDDDSLETNFNFNRVPSAYNTVIISKLILLNRKEIRRLLKDLGGREAWQEKENVMLGFIRSLDACHGWHNHPGPDSCHEGDNQPVYYEKLSFAHDDAVLNKLFLMDDHQFALAASADRIHSDSDQDENNGQPNEVNKPSKFINPDIVVNKNRLGFEPEMVFIKGGCFIMGSTYINALREKYDDLFAKSGLETPHEVCLKDFFISKKEAKYKETDSSRIIYTPNNHFDRSVSLVTPKQATKYAEWLSKKTGKRYRLPTEAEWEYAARGGVQTEYWWGNQYKKGCKLEKISDNRWNRILLRQTCGDESKISSKPTTMNPYGLYDMLGNVGEFTCSAFTKQYSGEEIQCASIDDARPRVLRGGTLGIGGVWWAHRSAYRESWPYNGFRYGGVGFRLVREVDANRVAGSL
jgi:formylglycine-generating enzyme required for sulfatase activity